MLQIHELVFDSWGRRFFDEATISLPVGSKVGLVGKVAITRRSPAVGF